MRAGAAVAGKPAIEQALAAHQAGNVREAARLYGAILAHQPRHANALHLMGLLLHQTDDQEGAERLIRRALVEKPDSALFLGNLGRVLKAKGDFLGALAVYGQSLARNPADAAVHNNMGNIHLSLRRHEDALNSFERACALDAEKAPMHYNRGNALARLGREDEALQAFYRATALDDGNVSADHMLAALTGQRRESAPEAYVEDLFDSYADSFDVELQEGLEYRVPALLREALLRHAPPGKRFRHAVDLGCGTGLSGLAIRDRVDRLTGIDLSARMLANARKRQCYEELHKLSILDFLERRGRYDLVLAADVLIYVGALEDTFAALDAHLAPTALLVFSVETDAGEGFTLMKTGRFAHSRPYVQRLADRHGWRLLEATQAPLRRHFDRHIEGTIYVLGHAAG